MNFTCERLMLYMLTLGCVFIFVRNCRVQTTAIVTVRVIQVTYFIIVRHVPVIADINMTIVVNLIKHITIRIIIEIVMTTTITNIVIFISVWIVKVFILVIGFAKFIAFTVSIAERP